MVRSAPEIACASCQLGHAGYCVSCIMHKTAVPKITVLGTFKPKTNKLTHSKLVKLPIKSLKIPLKIA